MSPDASSFLAHSRTSTISPSFSFLVVTFSLRAFSFAAPLSISNDSVRIVSFTTLNRFPLSSRKTVPWLPSSVIQPSRLSFMTFAWTLITSTFSSFIGPSMTSTISPTSRRRRVLLSLMLMPDVMTVSLETFMKMRMRFVTLSLLRKPSLSSSRLAKSLARSSGDGTASSGSACFLSPSLSSLSSPSFASPSLPPALALVGFGSLSHLVKNSRNSDSVILPSLSVSISANTSSFLSFLTRWWPLMMAMAVFSRAWTSSASFFLASSRNRAERLEALVNRGSQELRLACSFRTSVESHACRSTSMPSEMVVISCLTSATPSRASLTLASVSSESFSISTEAIEAPFAGVSACSPIEATFSLSDSIVFLISPIFSCSSALSSASLFSFASLAAFRSASMILSRAIPTETLSLWKRSFLTPFSPFSIRTFHIASMDGLGNVKLNSPLAYLRTSFWLSMPSLSTSYLSKTFTACCILRRASAFWTPLVFASLDAAKTDSLLRVYSLIRCRSFAMACLESPAGWPGASWTLISGPFFSTNSVQAFSFSFASWPASSTVFHVAVISSSSRSFSEEKGSDSSLSVFEARSASATRPSSSLTSLSAFSMASFRFLSASSLCSSAFRTCSLIISTRWLACSRPTSASCFIRSFCEPQASSSFCRTSSSSFFSSSMFSGLAERTFWMTLRMQSMARCSSRFWAISFSFCSLSASAFFLSSSCCCLISSMRLLCSSTRCLLASSIFFRFSSSCLRVASCCIRIFWSCSACCIWAI
mmetsp:Transcript_34177/g.106399  ORF Transcript_34177/g.106399 Transcript_34177/m.106399 type:complete len:764 (+) Transcript_34177:520-2811(+)